jgi:hypothetical protein
LETGVSSSLVFELFFFAGAVVVVVVAGEAAASPPSTFSFLAAAFFLARFFWDLLRPPVAVAASSSSPPSSSSSLLSSGWYFEGVGESRERSRSRLSFFERHGERRCDRQGERRKKQPPRSDYLLVRAPRAITVT